MQHSRLCLFAFAAVAVLAGCSSKVETATVPAPEVRLATAPYHSGSLAVHCGSLIDGIAPEPAKDRTVIIREGRIASIEQGSVHPAGLAFVELGGYTCLPGLIEMHDHITENSDETAHMEVYLHRTPEEQRALSAKQAMETLQAGFTSARNVGVYTAWTDRDLRDAINRGEVAGPRLQICGYYLTIANGGGDLILPGIPPAQIPERFHMGVAKGPEQFRQKAQQAIDGGADLLKVIASGAVLAYGGVPGAPEMTQEEIAAVVQVAHAAGRKVAAHAHGAQSIKDAIRAGADTIEHASLADDESIRLAVEHHVAFSMDIYNGDYIDTEGRKAKWPEEFLRKNLETTEAQREAFTRAHAAGVALVFGTDAGVYPHGTNARQFPIMVERGMTPMEAIQSATSVAAHYMGWDDRVGALVQGRYGDLIAVKSDPLGDIKALEDVSVVIKEGLAYKLPPPSP